MPKLDKVYFEIRPLVANLPTAVALQDEFRLFRSRMNLNFLSWGQVCVAVAEVIAKDGVPEPKRSHPHNCTNIATCHDVAEKMPLACEQGEGQGTDRCDIGPAPARI